MPTIERIRVARVSVNPAKKEKKAMKKKSKAHRAKRSHSTRAKSVKPVIVRVNPARPAGKRPRVRRNPARISARGIASTVIEGAKSAAVAFGGMVASREGAQMLLGANNNGTKGYLTQLGVGAAVSLVVGRVVSKQAGAAAMTGSVLSVLHRVVSDKYMPVPAVAALPLSGVGDPMTITSAPAQVAYLRRGMAAMQAPTHGAPVPITAGRGPVAAMGSPSSLAFTGRAA